MKPRLTIKEIERQTGRSNYEIRMELKRNWIGLEANATTVAAQDEDKAYTVIAKHLM